MACPSCGQFCTRNTIFVEIKTGDVNLESDVFGSILSSILQEVSAADPDIHAAGDMLPMKPAPFSLRGFPRTRASISSMAFYDPNMRSTISKIAVQHHQEWQPCSVCSMSRAAKQYVINTTGLRLAFVETVQVTFENREHRPLRFSLT